MSCLSKGGFSFVFDLAVSFFSTVIVRGYVSHESGREIRLNKALITGDGCLFSTTENVLTTSRTSRFQCEAIVRSKDDIAYLQLNILVDEVDVTLLLGDVFNSLEHASDRLFKRFLKETSLHSCPKILDIGGRARSGVLRASSFDKASITVCDILPGEGVDVIGDAHELSKSFASHSFDFCMSVSVFEHLLMPWKVAIEINKVMRTGGMLFIATHQTVGMHDLPCDYFRYSSDAWKGIFNEATGFEIIDTEMSGLNFIVPFVWGADRDYAEKTAGYEVSAVLLRKTGETLMTWPIDPVSLPAATYPE